MTNPDDLTKLLIRSKQHIQQWWRNFGEEGSKLPPAKSHELIEDIDIALNRISIPAASSDKGEAVAWQVYDHDDRKEKALALLRKWRNVPINEADEKSLKETIEYISSIPANKGEAVYQVKFIADDNDFDSSFADGEYFDVSKEAYDKETNPNNKRVLFTAPQQAIPAGYAVSKWQIEMEKLLCSKLNRTWQAGNISIESLIDELVHKAAPTAPIDGVDK